ncbi:mannose-specific lectin-like [Dendrobium catenatum]|uniref:Mannose-specific lectin n=1 Tax=Dendrobium catenatum TaxID=906689 RepID=A0A2I0VLD5_9ASPA|nr:mannose-specific lectin-like [Dendrobium catenatum]PKU64228.1 Mannose-specific lectin [Dendrobium catenatum]
MTITTYSAKSSVALLSTTLLLLLISSSSSTSFSTNINVLKSGQRLHSGSFLSLGNYVFAMQADCNLVLYNNNTILWSSNTGGKGKNCYLSLESDGELHIYGDGGRKVWRSETGGEYGDHALVLQPNGNVVIYGSPVWSTGLSYQTPNTDNYEQNTIN